MTFVRSIGRWALTGLVLNCVISCGIFFGVPGELNRLMGSASSVAMVFGALAVCFIITPFADLASQFSESGGVHLYARTAFRSFATLQVGWFFLLSITAAARSHAGVTWRSP
jgi:amino acid transporter